MTAPAVEKSTPSAFWLETSRPLVELAIGRPLRRNEQVVDVFALDRALNEAKDAVHRAVEREQARAVRQMIRTGHPIRLRLTRGMLNPLDDLFTLGRREALAELERAGYTSPARAFESTPLPPDPRHDELGNLAAGLESSLNGFSVKLQLEEERVRVALAVTHHGSIASALASTLLRVLGARSIAAGVVSTALFTGMGTTFEENQHLVSGWEVTAVLDGGTCAECEANDGTTFETWDDAQELLPNGGPAVYCLGGERCRCRLVPAAA